MRFSRFDIPELPGAQAPLSVTFFENQTVENIHRHCREL